MPLSERSLRRVAESMIADFGDGAVGAVDARITQAADQNLSAVAQSWRIVRRLIFELRDEDGTHVGANGGGQGDKSGGQGL